MKKTHPMVLAAEREQQIGAWPLRMSVHNYGAKAHSGVHKLSEESRGFSRTVSKHLDAEGDDPQRAMFLDELLKRKHGGTVQA